MNKLDSSEDQIIKQVVGLPGPDGAIQHPFNLTGMRIRATVVHTDSTAPFKGEDDYIRDTFDRGGLEVDFDRLGELSFTIPAEVLQAYGKTEETKKFLYLFIEQELSYVGGLKMFNLLPIGADTQMYEII